MKMLEKKAMFVCDAMAKLGDREDFETLIKMWRKPWFTTPAEIAFINGMLDGMKGQVEVMTQLRQDLVNACNKVTPSER